MAASGTHASTTSSPARPGSVAGIFESMSYGPAPEAEGAAQAWMEKHKKSFGHFIGNKWVKPAGRKTYTSKSPATGEVLTETIQGEEEDIELAVTAARKAFESWSTLSCDVRARYLYSVARHVQKHHRLLSVVESLDNGKSIRETRDCDIPLVVRHFYHHAGWAELMDSEMSNWKPVGVVGAIVPWNFPLMLLTWKVCPALAMGNTVVLKPATYTRLSALLFAEICAEAGLPPGVFNVVTGNGAFGSKLALHPKVDKVGFTGSTQVGQILRRLTAGSGKKLSLELGGKSPVVVFDSADLDSTVEGIVDAIVYISVQVCSAGSRLLVQETVIEELVDKLKARMKHLRLGHSLDKAIDMGPIVDPSQKKSISDYVEAARKEGAEVYQVPGCLPNGGCYYPPTLITKVQTSSTVVMEEIFGPVLVVLPFRTAKEAIAMGNNTNYGLAASVWTENISLAMEVALSLKAGAVWINSHNMFDAAAGFGGYKHSGYGRDGGKEVNYPVLVTDACFGMASPIYIMKEEGSDTHCSNSQLSHRCKLFFRWGKRAAHNRAQIVYYMAENLELRRDEVSKRMANATGRTQEETLQEVDLAIRRLFYWGAYADKYGGTVQETLLYGATVKIHEPMGVIGIACPDQYPLLSFVSLFAPAVVRGNTVVVIPSEKYPIAALDFYQVFETSDLPAGVVNIVTGDHSHLTKYLAEHQDIQAMWYFGTTFGSKYVEHISAENLKRTWVDYGVARDWTNKEQGQGEEFLYQCTQVKNVWIPMGETFAN
ncbi:aldehyde dehydrogenase family 16 member A1-like [Anneissia japonica]|uniref:aldehyde dehydrogenase family 16 member A1-like n=1 Tax=Anneissia japonica TaxID=1529436 RepID=UPI0014255C0E|nr:aldehyde dehydrogenase family 16 member A1-like [Anneissia japonica]